MVARPATRPTASSPLGSPRLVIPRVPVPALDHLNNPATLLPTAPDLTLVAPGSPTNQSSMSFSSPAPSLVLDLDTTPLSIRISEDESESTDSIRPGGNDPSGVNDQQMHSVVGNQVLGACEGRQARKGPWKVLGRLSTRARSPNPSKQQIKPSLADNHNQPHSPGLLPKPSLMLSASNLSVLTRLPSSTPSSPPPALSPPRRDASFFSHTTRSQTMNRVSTWLSPMKYDQDAQELVVAETGEIGTCIRSNVQHPPAGTKTAVPKSGAKKRVVSSLVSSWLTGNTSKSSKTPPALVVETDRASSTEDEEPSSLQSQSPENIQRQPSRDPIESTVKGSRSKQPRLLRHLRAVKIKQIW